MRKLFALVSTSTAAILGLLLVSCSGLFSSFSAGSVTLTLPGASSSARSASDGTGISDSGAIVKYELSFTMDGSVKTLTALPGATITQDGLDAGTWTITGKAVSADNAVIGYGTSSAEVAAGKTTKADLAMSFNSYANLTSIAVTRNPAKTEYTIGDAVDCTGIEITASFKSGWKCVLDTSSLKDSLTYSPAEGSTLTSFTDKVTVTFTSGTTVCTADFPITVSVDAPVISKDETSDNKRITVNTAVSYSVTAACKGKGELSFQWIQTGSTKASYTTDSGTPETTDSGTTQTGTITVSPSAGGSDDYYCIVTNTNSGLTKTAESVHFTVEYTAAALASITAEPKAGSYVLVGNEPTANMFTVTEAWSDSSTTTASPAEYTVEAASTTYVGDITVTVTLTADTSIKCTVTVPYKYTMVAPTNGAVSPSSSSIAQYTGTATLTASCGSFTSYSTSDGLNIADTVTYQWYSAATSDGSGTPISGATNATYTPPVTTAGTVWYHAVLTTKCGSDATYCANSTETLTAAIGRTAVTVTPWTLSLTDTTATISTSSSITNGGTQALTAGHKYSISFINDSATEADTAVADSSAVTWAGASKPSDFTFASSCWTFTAPAATTAEQTIALTATATINSISIPFGAVTFTVPALPVITTSDELKTAVTDGGTVIVSGNITMTEGLTVSKDTVITVPSGGTATLTRGSSLTADPLFTVSSGASLTLGNADGTLTIDGGSAESNPVSAASPLIDNSGTLTLNTGCTLQNNTNSGNNGGAVITRTGSVTTIQGATITKCSSKYGAGIYMAAGSCTLSSGELSYNTASDSGGGINIADGSFTVTGGTISHNSATSWGGGIYLLGTLSLEGGTISSNTCGSSGAGGGIYVPTSCTAFNLKGTPAVSSNTDGTNANNVYFVTPATKCATITGSLTGASLGIYISNSSSNKGTFTSGWSTYNSTLGSIFTSDNSGYTVAVSGNEVCLQ